MQSPQWATYLPIKTGSKETIESKMRNKERFEESDVSGVLSYYREYKEEIRTSPTDHRKVDRVEEILTEVTSDFVLVYSGKRKARFVKNRLNEEEGIEVSNLEIELSNLYDIFSKESIVEPKKIHLTNYSLNKFVKGSYRASVSQEENFEELLEKDPKSMNLLVKMLSDEKPIKFFRNGQIRILGASEENFEIIKKMTTYL
jgi:hypothetical protein